MADYFDIFGFKVQYLSSDPSDVTKGQVWYNSTTNISKVRGFSAASFTTSSTQNRPSDPSDSSGSNSVFNDCVKAGGRTASSYGVNDTESWDGSAWTNESSRPWAAWGGGAGGPPSYFLNAGGYKSPSQPSGTPGSSVIWSGYWNPSGWTSLPNLSAPRGKNFFGICGTATAAITTAGYVYGSPTGAVSNVEEWDGSSWTSSTSFPAAIYNGFTTFGSSIPTTHFAGGYGPSPSTLTQHFTYDGSSWTILPAAIPNFLGSATGAPDNAIGFYDPGASLLWDGSTWSSNPVTGAYTPPSGLGRSGNGSKAIVWIDSYNHPSQAGKTFIWEGAEVATQTIATS